MNENPTHEIAVRTDGGRQRAIGLDAPGGTIRSIHLVNSQAPAVFLRRFRGAAAVCISDRDRWPSELHLHVVVAGSDPLVRAVPIDEPAPNPRPSATQADPPASRLDAIERWLVEQAPQEAQRRDALLFHGIDRSFNAQLLRERGAAESPGGETAAETEAIIRAVSQLQREIIDRLRIRQRGGRPRRTALAMQSDELIRPALTQAFRRRFESGAPGSTTGQALATFARFGSGALAVEMCAGVDRPRLLARSSNGCPNGPMVFAFAEYALFQIESAARGSDPAFWARLLPGCVLAAEMYLAAYALHSREGRVLRRPFESSTGRTASSLRVLSARSFEEMVRWYEVQALAPDEPAHRSMEQHLGSLLAAAFHPIRRADFKRPLPVGTGGSHAWRGAGTFAVFPCLPEVHLAPGWRTAAPHMSEAKATPS